MTTEKERHVPPGWDYNPSSWPQRVPLIIVAFVGFVIAMYLGLYQLRVFDTVWEPFFGEGSKRVLNSELSRTIGGTSRWRTKPWIVILFGIAIGPLGLVSVLLVISQPILVNSWCTLCIITAVISVVMISPAMDELLASMQYLQRVKKSGHSVGKGVWGKASVVNNIR